MADLTYISEGNDKTSCFSFDLPAKATCPGATELCASKCYAFKLSQAYPNVGRKYDRNMEFANSDAFVNYMIRNIPKRCEFRIHVSGDFYSIEYIRRWIQIAVARPDVQFYAYTRSWRVNNENGDPFWPHLHDLGSLANVTLNLSVDSQTGKPNVDDAESFRWCYLSLDDSAADWLRRTDIVFRTNHTARRGGHQWWRKQAVEKGEDPDKTHPLLHRIAGAIVCPFERGRKLDNFSCSQCGLCVNKPKVAVMNA